MDNNREGRHEFNQVGTGADPRARDDCPVLVVGIGFSAGGLKSLEELFTRMPPGHGVAFVLIQHLEPSGENLTVKLLREQTSIPVV